MSSVNPCAKQVMSIMPQDVALTTDLPHPHLPPYAVIGDCAFLTWNKVCTITSSRFGQCYCLHFYLKENQRLKKRGTTHLPKEDAKDAILTVISPLTWINATPFF